MGKGKRAQKSGALPSRELYERMSFLYQASQFYATLPSGHSPSKCATEPAAPEAAPGAAPGAASKVASKAASEVTSKVALLAVEGPSDSNPKEPGHNPAAPLMPTARFLAKELRQVARKSVLRLSPHIKRDMCKACLTPLIPGVSCTVRVRARGPGPRINITCMCCGCRRRLLAYPGHVLFVDQGKHSTIH